MKDNMEVISEYVSCGCNRTPNAVDWGSNGLIIYASCRSIAIYDPKFCNGAGIVTRTLVKHTSRVNSVRWISTNDENRKGKVSSFLSSSSDKTCVLWMEENSSYVPVIAPLCHDSIVNIADGIDYVGTEGVQTYIASATSSSKLYIWRKENSDLKDPLQIIDCKRGFALNLKFFVLPVSNALVLACAGEDSAISLYSMNENDQFDLVLKLPGHEDWVRGLDVTTNDPLQTILLRSQHGSQHTSYLLQIFTDSGEVLLASSSQDHFIRIWKISEADCSPDEEIKSKKTKLQIWTQRRLFEYDVMLESVLSSHENWIYGVHWHPPFYTDGKRHQPMKLLSSSMDKTMILWYLDEENGLWVDQVRVGEVGGNTLGFYGNKFSPDGQSILAHGYQGAFHIWHQSDVGLWNPGVTVGGHFSEVQDLVWDVNGKFILSVSTDQTTRLHAPWVQNNENDITWHEIARPQVHGYDMTCLSITKDYLLISGADEKVLRAFHAPKNFIENLQILSQIKVEKNINDLPEGASVPSLGLSNKAVYEKDIINVDTEEERHPKDHYPEISFKPSTLSAPPTEEHLLQNSLWPEIQKLYGHGYELFCVAVNHKGTLIASACKASQVEHASIIIWDISNWKQKCSLRAHKLTVTQLAFSPDDNYLLSVSRDRTWTLHCMDYSSNLAFTCVAKSTKDTSIHSRIIWSCSWMHDSKYFITASRDKKLIVWGKNISQTSENSILKQYKAFHIEKDFEDSMTAVAAAPAFMNDEQYLIASGCDNGSISLHSWNCGTSVWVNLTTIHYNICHNLTVKRLQFKPENKVEVKDKNKNFYLASCGSDFSVRIFKLKRTLCEGS
ncbi:Elongator complex protein 2 [Nymphon striatum]|nr:Elongator complex protein 2 [Nymphon striatum]